MCINYSISEGRERRMEVYISYFKVCVWGGGGQKVIKLQYLDQELLLVFD